MKAEGTSRGDPGRSSRSAIPPAQSNARSAARKAPTTSSMWRLADGSLRDQDPARYRRNSDDAEYAEEAAARLKTIRDLGEFVAHESVSVIRSASPIERSGVPRIAALARRPPVVLQLGRAGDRRRRSRRRQRGCLARADGVPPVQCGLAARRPHADRLRPRGPSPASGSATVHCSDLCVDLNGLSDRGWRRDRASTAAATPMSTVPAST